MLLPSQLTNYAFLEGATPKQLISAG